ncbi:MAG: YdcF family protein [Holdemanella sp.]|nr:YdcF family protein [Holdemanella sp.]
MKKIFILIGSLFFIFYIGPVIISFDFNIGVLTGLIISLCCFLCAYFYDSIKKMNTIFLRCIFLILCLCVCIGCIPLSKIMIYSTPSHIETDYIIVLGCKVNKDKPGKYLQGRIDTAYDYLVHHPSSKAILSGGKGDDESISEALCMYNELVSKGIDSHRLIIEDASTSTYENFKYSKNYLKNMSEITIITNDFHEYRAIQYAKMFNLKGYAYPYKTSIFTYFPYATREIYALLYMTIIKS